MKEKNNIKNKLFNLSSLFIIIGIVVVINIIAAFVYMRVDTTDDERFSLTPGTIQFLKDFKDGKIDGNGAEKSNRLFLRIYLDGELPAEIKRFKYALETKLQEFKNIAGTRIEYEFVDPNVDNEAEKSAIFAKLLNKGKGILPLELDYQKDAGFNKIFLWPGAEVTYGTADKTYAQFLPGTPQGQPQKLDKGYTEGTIQNAINNLEYMLISTIRKAVVNKRPRIAFIQGHGELHFKETQRVRSLVKDYYSIEDLTLGDSLAALDGFKGAIIADPKTPFTDKDLYILDQFVMKGGSLFVMMDKLDFPRDSIFMKGAVNTTRTNLRLDRMLYTYGIKTEDNFVIDARCPEINLSSKDQSHRLPWFFHILASSSKHPIARNLEPVELKYASQISLIPGKGRVVSPVLTSSSNSNITGLAPIISLAMPLNFLRGEKAMFLNQNPESESNKLCLAGLTEGYFDSHFKNRLIDAFAKNKEVGFLEKSKKEGKILVVANGDLIRNFYDSTRNDKGEMMYRPMPFNNLRFDLDHANRQEKLILGNQEFFQNSLDFLLGDNSVLDIRSKQIELHKINMDKVKESGGFYQLMNLILPSSLVILLSIVLLQIRKRRYTSTK